MKRNSTNLKTRLYFIAVTILLVGLCSAVLIYLKAEKASHGVLGFEVTDGYSYSIAPEDSKKYRHDLELYGGKANVLADEFRRWFVGLWEGKSLAFTVACITAGIAFVFFFIANLPGDIKSEPRR